MDLNALRWDRGTGHYEAWFLTLNDRGSGTGIWIRFAMHAPQAGPADCSLWFCAMHPDGTRVATRRTFPIDALREEPDPRRLIIADAELSARGTAGAFDDVRWELLWEPADRPGLPVHPLVERARLARTMYVIPQPSVAIEGSVTFDGREIELSGARGAQAHLWGAKHAGQWGWMHASDLESTDGEPRAGDWIDGISIVGRRFGRAVGPHTSVVGCLLGDEFEATSPRSVLRATSSSTLACYRAQTATGTRRVAFDVQAPRETLVGVTYDDPDGELMRCWNTEVASAHIWVWDRTSRRGGAPWMLRDTLQAPGRACFEYAQRELLADVPIHIA